jgi:two-component system sensor histidine kinase YesM
MNIFRRFKIRHQLFFMVGACVLFVMIIQGVLLFRFVSITRKNLEQDAASVLSQLENNIQTVTRAVAQAAETIAYDSIVQNFMISDNYQQRAEYVSYIRSMMMNTMSTNQNILGIFLRDQQGRYTNHSTGSTVYYPGIVERIYDFSEDRQREKGSFIVFPSGEVQGYAYILPYPLFGSWNSTGYCCVVFGNSVFLGMLQGVDPENKFSLFLVDREKRILASHQGYPAGQIIDPELAAIAGQGELSRILKYKGTYSLVKYHVIPEIEWGLISVVPIQSIMKPLNGLMLFVLIALLVLLGGLLFLSMTIFRFQAKLYDTELAKKDAEFMALQSQINPHFLYNTLDCIRVIAHLNKVPEIVTVTSAMAAVFRYCIRQDKLVTVKDEIDCIDNYLETIRVRYDNRFQVEKDIDPDILPLRVIKFIFQPVIENALYHGLEKKPGPGMVRISGRFGEKGDIVFEVFDSGAGIEPDLLARLNNDMTECKTEGSGFALLNINRRIKNEYGQSYGLSIESEYGSWCKVIIRINTAALKYTE